MAEPLWPLLLATNLTKVITGPQSVSRSIQVYKSEAKINEQIKTPHFWATFNQHLSVCELSRSSQGPTDMLGDPFPTDKQLPLLTPCLCHVGIGRQVALCPCALPTCFCVVFWFFFAKAQPAGGRGRKVTRLCPSCPTSGSSPDVLSYLSESYSHMATYRSRPHRVIGHSQTCRLQQTVILPGLLLHSRCSGKPASPSQGRVQGDGQGAERQQPNDSWHGPFCV